MSVRQSHAGILFQRLYVSSNFFHVTTVFQTKRYGNIPTGTPFPKGDVECKGCGRLSWLSISFLLHVKYTLSYRMVSYEKHIFFDQHLALSRKWCKIEPQLLWKANRIPHPSFRMLPVSVTSSSIGACRWRCFPVNVRQAVLFWALRSREFRNISKLPAPKPWREAKIKLAQIFLHRS